MVSIESVATITQPWILVRYYVLDLREVFDLLDHVKWLCVIMLEHTLLGRYFNCSLISLK